MESIPDTLFLTALAELSEVNEAWRVIRYVAQNNSAEWRQWYWRRVQQNDTTANQALRLKVIELRLRQ